MKTLKRLALIRFDISFVCIALVWIALQWDVILLNFGNDTWSESAFFSGVFDWSSIQTGFLFGVYAIMAGGGKGFLNAAAKHEGFKRSKRYVERTMWLALLTTILTFPLLVNPPDLSAGEWLSVGFAMMVIYVVAAAYMLGRFVRCLRQFVIVMKDKDADT